jgi:hypothetical protein
MLMFLSIDVFSLDGEILLASSPSTFIFFIFSHSTTPDDFKGTVFQNLMGYNGKNTLQVILVIFKKLIFAY